MFKMSTIGTNTSTKAGH